MSLKISEMVASMAPYVQEGAPLYWTLGAAVSGVVFQKLSHITQSTF